MAELPVGIVAFLFTDIETSMRRWEAFPAEMRQAVLQHDALLRAAITDAGGHIFQTAGDSFLAAFATAPAALAGALAAQRALRAAVWPAPIGELRVRMALHVGPAEIRDGEYYAHHPVNRLARLLAAGHGGQILVSGAAREQLLAALPAEVTLRDLGLRRLKDMIEPLPVYQVLAPDLPADFPPLKTLDAHRHNLPVQLTSFVGRERELADVQRLLGVIRLLTLTGAGGSGKTRLSLQAAANLVDDFPDGVWFVELAPLADPALVPQTVAQVLDIREEAGRPLAQTLADRLRDKRLLLILDNCEHLVEAAARLAETLLRASAGLRVLATSREALGIAGETTYRVPSLSVPDPQHLPPIPGLSQYEAVRLFIDRALAVQPTFQVTNANAPALAQLCVRLDGIPLALELAAARVRVLTVEQIAVRLDDRFRLLTGGSRTALPRQQTLRALVDWSYDLLSGPEQALLRRLAVFAGGWTLEAAEAICVGEKVEEYEILDLLGQLANKSLLLVEETGGEARYSFLETIRQYGAEKLVTSGDAEAVRARHAAFFLALAERADARLAGPEQARWLDHLEAEHDNFRAALAWSVGSSGDPGTHLRLAAALGWFWFSRGYYGEGRTRLAAALDRGPGTGPARAKALQAAGWLAYRQFDFRPAQALYEQSVGLWRALDTKVNLANALNGLARVLNSQGATDEAAGYLREALALARSAGDAAAEAFTLVGLGHVTIAKGDLENARAFYEEARTLREAAGDQAGLAVTLQNLGEVARAMGAYDQARAFIEQYVPIARLLGNKATLSAGLQALGQMTLEQGDPVRAAALSIEALALGRELGDPNGIACGLINLAGVAAWDHPERAARLLGAAASLPDAFADVLRSPWDRQGYERNLAAARAHLDGPAWDAAYAAGQAMSLDDAVAYALAEPGDAEAPGP